jgi:diadenosine tetraphosphate (Ap4A) HIT family hydrolase
VAEFDGITMEYTRKNCPFCKAPGIGPLIIGEYCVSFLDQFPVSDGHCLVVPKRHVKTIDELSDSELKDLYAVLKQTKDWIIENHNPPGFNIGINEGEVAGQTVEHLHVHIIPRYEGDVVYPRGGIRGVIPSKKVY